MRFRFFLLWCAVFTVLLLGAWGLFCLAVVSSQEIRVEEREFCFPQWPASAPPVRAVVLADAHVASWEGEKLERIVQRITALKPDVIFLLGDFPYGVRNRYSLPEEACYAALAPLAQAAPVLYVIGNHDNYYRRMRREFRRLGFLRCGETTRRLYFSAGQRLDVIGFSWSYGAKLDRHLPNNLAAADAERVPLLALAHYPESFYKHPLPQVDLVLAAHTHGGQLCDGSGMPLRGFGELSREQSRGGWHTRPDGKPLYITRGIGMSQIPLRLNCPAEITLLQLRGGMAAEESAAPPQE